MKITRLLPSTALTWALLFFVPLAYAQNALVFQSDFGLKDGAVSAMKGVALNQSSFAAIHGIEAGADWKMELSKCAR